jgi:hypothetical protein
MQTGFSKEDLAFGDEVRAFLAAELPEDMAGKYASLESCTRDAQLFWQKKLADKGWLVNGWPSEHGGCDWSITQRFIYSSESQKALPPMVSPFGLAMVAPVIYTFGTDEQKERFLPGIKSGETLWCQGYSEPGSGSDLASLKTRADRDGDHYIVNGQKIWTSYAHWAEYIFCLVRTNSDGKKQEGISFLLIDMKTPGITVKPIISIDNQHHLNEVFFEDVRVPVENRIGEENLGWTYAKFLLTHERAGTAGVAGTKNALARLKMMARSQTTYSAPMANDPAFAAKLSELSMDIEALEYTEMRALSAAVNGGPGALELSSPLKLRGTELQQRLTELTVELLGNAAQPLEFDAPAGGSNEPSFYEVGPDRMKSYLFGRASTIYGGSSEVQRNIVAKAVLGL